MARRTRQPPGGRRSAAPPWSAGAAVVCGGGRRRRRRWLRHGHFRSSRRGHGGRGSLRGCGVHRRRRRRLRRRRSTTTTTASASVVRRDTVLGRDDLSGFGDDCGVVGEVGAEAVAFAEAGGPPECPTDEVGVAGSAEVAEVQAVATDEGGFVGRLGGPVDDADVVVVGGDLVDRVVDIGAVGTELGDGEQHRRAWRQTVDDVLEIVGEHALVGAVVVAEHHHGDVPSGIETVVENALAEVDEAAALGIHLDLPAAGNQLLAHLTAVATRRRRHDRVADHQHTLAFDELARWRPAGVRLGIGGLDGRQPALAGSADVVQGIVRRRRARHRRARKPAPWIRVGRSLRWRVPARGRRQGRLQPRGGSGGIVS